MFPRTVKVGTIDYVAGQKKTIDLPRDGVITQINIRLQYTHDNAAAGPAGPFFQTLARLVRRVDIVMGGRDTVVSQSGEMLAARAAIEFGAVPDGVGDTVVLTNSASTLYDVTLPIVRYLPRSNTPLATADDVRRVKQATLEITWAAAGGVDFFATPDAAFAISAVTCEIEVEYLIDVAPSQGFLVRQLSQISEDVPATNDAQAITIDGQTGLLVRSIMVAALDDTVGANTILNKMKVQSGTLVFHDNEGAAIQAMNKTLYSQEALITGLYFRPLTFAGDLSQAINTDPASIPADLKALFDVTKVAGTNTLLLSVESVRPPKLT